MPTSTRWDPGGTWLGGVALDLCPPTQGPWCCCGCVAALLPTARADLGFCVRESVAPLVTLGLALGTGGEVGGHSPALGSQPPHLAAGKRGSRAGAAHPVGSVVPSCPAGWGALGTGSTGLLRSLAPPAAGIGPFIVWRRGRSSSGAGREYPGRRIHAWLLQRVCLCGREQDATFDIPAQDIILPSALGWQNSVLPPLLQSLQLELLFATDYKA